MKRREAILMCLLAYALGIGSLASNAASLQNTELNDSQGLKPLLDLSTFLGTSKLVPLQFQKSNVKVERQVTQQIKQEVKVQHDSESVDVDVHIGDVEVGDVEVGKLDVQVDKEMQEEFDRDYPEKATEIIRNSYPIDTKNGVHTIEVNNVFGSIKVVAGNSDKVELVVNKTIRGINQSKIESARKLVTLDVDDQDGTLLFYVNGPFRCNSRNDGDDEDRCGRDCHGRGGKDCGVHIHGEPGYIVQMDFELRVPAHSDLVLRTVNSGGIYVQGVSGKYYLRNVNGGIEMVDVGGSGSARTINGGVKASFRENPREASSFYSLNGNVDLEFNKGLGADFYFKTFNGGVYTDYALTALPTAAMTGERKNGKFILRTNRSTGGRVGNGGPEIHVENFNGDIHVREHSL